MADPFPGSRRTDVVPDFGADASDAGQQRQAIGDLLKERDPALHGRIASAGQRQPHREQAAGLESGIDGPQTDEAAP